MVFPLLLFLIFAITDDRNQMVEPLGPVLVGLVVVAIGISFGGLAACSKSDSGAKPGGGTGEEPKLNFYNWDTYIGETTLEEVLRVTRES